MLSRYCSILLIICGCIFFTLIPGCGNMSVRRSQDWSDVNDMRLFHTVHVGNWGSGVLLEHTKDQMLVLTCAHLVEDNQTISIYMVDPQDRRYRKYRARVIRKSHPHREDLALLSVLDPPAAPEKPFKLELAEDFQDGETRTVSIMNISLGTGSRPFSLKQCLVEQKVRMSSYIPDAAGKTSWMIPKGLMLGGIREANSGSPVFEGDRLVGLNESSMGGLAIHAGLPQVIRTFLECRDWESGDPSSQTELPVGPQKTAFAPGKARVSDLVNSLGPPAASQLTEKGNLVLLYKIQPDTPGHLLIFDGKGILIEARAKKASEESTSEK